MEAILDKHIDPSELPNTQAIITGVKQVAVALYFKDLINFEDLGFCWKTGLVPNNLSAAGFEPLFKSGIILDAVDDAAAFLCMQSFYKNPTLLN